MTPGAATCRPVSSDEASGIPALAGYAHTEGIVMMIAERDAAIRCAAVLDPRGTAIDASAPALRVVHRAPDTNLLEEIRPLLTAMLEAAAGTGARRLTIGWDPMDAAGLRLLESVGFAPTGAGPYFEVGPGQVQYVTGYQDAGGSLLDLAIDLADP